MADKESRQQTIFGWTGIQETQKGDMLIFLYDPNPGLKWHVATIYEEELIKLPLHVQADVKRVLESEGVDTATEGALTKAKAEGANKMHFIEPEFTIWLDGKRINWEKTGNLASPSASGQSKQAGSANEAYSWEELTPEQLERASKLAGEVAIMQWQLADEVVKGFADTAGVDDNDILPDVFADLMDSVYKSTSYEFAKLWPTVRGAYTKPVDDSEPNACIEAITNADIGDFFDVLVECNTYLADANHAKEVLKATGETSLKKTPEDRVVQAKKAWTYIDLIEKYGQSPAMAKQAVDLLYDQIPF